MSKWRMVLAYLRRRRLTLLFYGLCVALVLAVQALSGQEMLYAWYIVLLASFLLLVIFIYDGRHFFQKMKTLQKLQEHLTAVEESLPAAADAMEEQYGALITGLCGKNRKLEEAIERMQTEDLDYYTLWVHQIKTPIAALRLVLNRCGAPENAVMEQELFKIQQYAELALQYVRLGDIASDLVIERCSLEGIVRKSVKKYGLLFVYQKLSVEVEPMEVQVFSDEKWLGFLIEQLLSNAVKYTRQGGVRIFWREESLWIEDTGIGIRPEDLPRIFEKGYTGCNGRADTRASGIGLYLSKRVADALAIRLSVSSELGTGTRVRLHFPSRDTFLFQ